MDLMRLVITGPVGAGKTTYIRTVSEIQVVDTDRAATDETATLKKNTTVAMDFGKVTFGSDMVLHIYGTPGQSRFDFMWDMLIQRAHAYILLVPAHRPEEFRQARQILAFMQQRVQIPMMIGVTHLDQENAWSIDDIGLAVWGDYATCPPIVGVNADDQQSVIESLIVLVEHCLTKTSH
jgi:uncharacterized protein